MAHHLDQHPDPDYLRAWLEDLLRAQEQEHRHLPAGQAKVARLERSLAATTAVLTQLLLLKQND